jgi:hypothetical protein
MWRFLRITVLLFVLAIVAWSYFYDRLSTTQWTETVWIGVYPINAEGTTDAGSYISKLTPASVVDIEQFINREARRNGIAIDRPVRVELYPEVKDLPPEHRPGDNVFQTAWWSLRIRNYARTHSRAAGRPVPRIRVFVLYHDPTYTRSVPHSLGLQKGLVGVVHAFADAEMTRPNNVVIAHEILHTLGATDKYDPASLAPVFPAGYAEPDRKPLYPQNLTEIMAGRYAVDDHTFEMPESLATVQVGPATAREIRWIK